MKAADALLAGLVDYAGLFPPASQNMRAAVESYASYLLSPDRAALGRFIVPLSRLAEFEDAARDSLPTGPEAEPWRLSVLVAEDVASAAERIVAFNSEHGPDSKKGIARIDVVELKASTPDDISRKKSLLPPDVTVYFEIPLSNPAPIVEAIAAAKGRAKCRTGGITSDAFPSADEVLDFMVACARKRVPFKATAGLHHPVRGSYNLTYEQGSARGTMFGFLNVFLAAALLYRGDNISLAKEALMESDPSTFRISDTSIEWRGTAITGNELKQVRGEFAVSFGSCSFREPVDELHEIMSEVHA